MRLRLAQGCAFSRSAAADPGYDRARMRWWIPVLVAALMLGFGDRPAGERRSAALAVRVMVVRSCSVNTDAPGSPGLASTSVVRCDSKSGPAARTSTSFVEAPVAAASTPPPPTLVQAGPATAIRTTAALADDRSVASPQLWEGLPSGPTRQSDADSSVPDEPRRAIRLITVNF
jgi:hypothetical protein